MSTLILGEGVTGEAVGRYLSKRGEAFAFADEKAGESFSLKGVDRVVKSPGFAWDHPWVAAALEAHIPVTTEIDLALRCMEGRRLIGITGSNGKTTTALLTMHLLEAVGVKACVAGNIGTPLINVIDEPWDVCVVELSSYQLERVEKCSALEAAAILNITPNHAERYASFEEYTAAKRRIYDLLKPGASCYVSFDDSLPFDGHIADHDHKNSIAAYLLSGISEPCFRAALKTFRKPPHRLEYVRQIGGVHFINDSKATSVDAVEKAVCAIEGKVQLIAGGVDKGGDFADWIPYFRDKVRIVYALGEAQERLVKELMPAVPVKKIGSLEEGVHLSFKCAKQGETILLSPGCSSFDLFENYEERGERFKELVLGLEER